jgi:tetratricopeptide (TPR) repeat protein
MPVFRLFLLSLFASIVALGAEPSAAQRELQGIITRQQKLLARAAATDEENIDADDFKQKVQDICYEYDDYIKKHPDIAAAYAAYGMLLGKIDMRRQALSMLLKANNLDQGQPLVKNQLGNYLAEDGHPLEALSYFLAAIKLDPKEPLYHYQVGMLLNEAKDEFLKSPEWTRDSIEHSMHKAFQNAAELAPDRIEFTYRYCESFYDLQNPNWDEALKAWSALEERAKPGVEKETIRLHRANILIKQKKMDQARILLATVAEGMLMKQKEKLIAQLPESQKK